MEVTRLSREEVGGIREATRAEDRTPRILCWNCRRLTPFHEERCAYCGARFAGSTGGMYGKFRTVTPRVPEAPQDDEELVQARRSLLQLFEDLQRVHDVSSSRLSEGPADVETITLFQCPSCGRFVAEDAADCACGVRFATDPKGHVYAGGEDAGPAEVSYACPVCGAEVSEDAVRCACGARFQA